MMIIFNNSGKMESNHLIFTVVISAFFILSFCDGASSSYLDNPSDQQCTWFFRDNPDDCRTYYQCLHGRSVLRRCPRKLHWNADGHYCEHMQKSTCKTSASKRKGSSAATSASTSILEVYDSRRVNIHRGKFREPCNPPSAIYPYKPDCSKFVQCGQNNVAHIQSCPPGLLFNPAWMGCDWPQNVECSSSSGGGSDSGSGSVASVTTFPTTTTSTPRPTQSTTSAPTAAPPVLIITPSTTTTTTTIATTPTTTTTSTTARPTTTTPTTTRPTTTESPTKYPILIPSSETDKKYKVVCYFTNWSVYRKNGGAFTPEDIDPSKCTHIIYAFACLNHETYALQMCDTWIDGKEGKDFYGKVTALKKFGVTVTVAVGGWNDSAYSKWTLMLKDYTKMEAFIKSVCEFLKKYNFDGIDLDYEYPSCPQANCNFDSKFEKQAFVTLIKGLRQMCGPQTVLSAAVSCNENIIKEAYDVPTMAKYLDFINLMAYDFHGAWESKTGINAPQEHLPPDDNHLNANHAVETFSSLGAPLDKLCLGMPMYGQTFMLDDPLKHNNIGAKTRGPGTPGPCTKQKGMLAYYEICNQTWTKTVHDKEGKVGPYSYNINDGSWVSHDDISMVKRKSEYIKRKGLGGGMIWALDFDDFRNTCGGGRYPLLSMISEVLRSSEIPASAKRRVVKGGSSSSKSSSNTNKTSNRTSNRVSRGSSTSPTSSRRQRKSRRET